MGLVRLYAFSKGLSQCKDKVFIRGLESIGEGQDGT
jgi:hypothetical protein